jgi:hypothetical protein
MTGWLESAITERVWWEEGSIPVLLISVAWLPPGDPSFQGIQRSGTIVERGSFGRPMTFVLP